ncbi:uncharacterized protein LOC143776559 [Ranitomeya variabilis]|uniref:uncharacterized protein LOC143776559 n=1 Tax=Ranitomeya variabilis TaxID=490064 RepID=UPI0040571CF0
MYTNQAEQRRKLSTSLQAQNPEDLLPVLIQAAQLCREKQPAKAIAPPEEAAFAKRTSGLLFPRTAAGWDSLCVHLPPLFKEEQATLRILEELAVEHIHEGGFPYCCTELGVFHLEFGKSPQHEN